jgi:hypothetical protein
LDSLAMPHDIRMDRAEEDRVIKQVTHRLGVSGL